MKIHEETLAGTGSFAKEKMESSLVVSVSSYASFFPLLCDSEFLRTSVSPFEIPKMGSSVNLLSTWPINEEKESFHVHEY